MKTTALLAAFFAAASAFAQPADMEALLAGVEPLPKSGAPGPVAVWGDGAFPVLTARDAGDAECALVAAAAHGKGRIVLIGHNGYYYLLQRYEVSLIAPLSLLSRRFESRQEPRA